MVPLFDGFFVCISNPTFMLRPEKNAEPKSPRWNPSSSLQSIFLIRMASEVAYLLNIPLNKQLHNIFLDAWIAINGACVYSGLNTATKGYEIYRTREAAIVFALKHGTIRRG